MKDIRIPLSVPADQKSEYKKNYSLLTNNSGRLLLIAGDQKVEHLNADFFGTGIAPEDANPEHLFKIAARSDGGVLATHLGLVSRYGQDYRQLPYIIKINGRTNIGSNEEKNSSRRWWTVEQILRFKKQSGLKIVGIGYTVYLGAKYEAKMLSSVARSIFEAHQAGLTAIVWMYPRGKNIKEENIDVIAGGAGVAAALDADFVKVKFPYGSKDKKNTAKKFKQVTAAAGRTKVICVGGDKRPVKDLLEQLANQINIAESAGLAIGRNLHQRPLEEATRLTAALGSIIFKKASLTEANSIYLRKKTASSKKNTKFFGFF